MNHIVRFDGYGKQNEVFRGLGTALGRVAGTITNALSGRLQPRNTSDNDLAREILAYVQNMPRDYNDTGQFNNRTPNKTQNTSYMFVGNPFDTMFMNEETVEVNNIPQNIRQSIPQNAFVDNGRKVNFKKVDRKKKLELKKLIWSYSEPTNNDWRIDVLQHGDYKTTNEPEYSIYISKVKGGEVRPFEDARERGKNTEDEPKESGPSPENKTQETPKSEEQKPSDKPEESTPNSQTTKKNPLLIGTGNTGTPKKSTGLTTIPNYYGILGISPSATPKEIESAYKEKTKLLDAAKKPEDKQKLIQLGAAKTLLLDDGKRKQYDDKYEEEYGQPNESFNFQSDSHILKFHIFEQITGSNRQRNFGGRGSGGVNLGSLDTPTKLDLGPTFDKNQQLACTQGLANEIWQECYTINQAVTKTPTGDARGGFASRHLLRPRY